MSLRKPDFKELAGEANPINRLSWQIGCVYLSDSGLYEPVVIFYDRERQEKPAGFVINEMATELFRMALLKAKTVCYKKNGETATA